MKPEPLKGKIHIASINNSLVVDESFVTCNNVKSAVEWLKFNIKEDLLKHNDSLFKGIDEAYYYGMVCKKIDEAFEDVIDKGDE